jgi:hypothetical protein
VNKKKKQNKTNKFEMNLRGNNLILKLAFIVSCSGMLSLTEMKTK